LAENKRDLEVASCKFDNNNDNTIRYSVAFKGTFTVPTEQD